MKGKFSSVERRWIGDSWLTCSTVQRGMSIESKRRVIKAEENRQSKAFG